jgi:hypothetical protein
MKRLGFLLAFLFWSVNAHAGVSCSLPFTLTNGTTADATQVMANYNAIITCLGNAAAAGNNSDITSLSGLTTPIPPNEGGTLIFTGTTSAGSANAQTLSATTPSNFSLTRNYAVVFTAGFTNTGPTQFNINATGLTNVFRMTPSGPQALTGGEIVAGNLVVAFYDGTQFELLSVHAQFGGYGPQTNLASASTTDLGTVPSHNIKITGTTTITSFGASASTTYPIYIVTFTAPLTVQYNQTNCATTGNCINLTGNASITVAAGDTMTLVYLGTGSGGGGNWQAVNYQQFGFTPASVNVTPQGYLGLLSGAGGGPILSGSDVTAATTIYYTPYVGNLIPIWNGSTFSPLPFTELSLALSASAQGANGIYDACVFNNSGTLTLVFGPAWATATAGSGARGSGVASAQITRINGIWVNAVAITGNNGVTSYSIPVNQCTIVGSVFIDGTAGQVSGYRTWGSSRKFGVWNFYNRVPICLLAGDSTANWSYTTATVREANGSTTNTAAVFTGLAEEEIVTEYKNYLIASSDNSAGDSAGGIVGVGYNSTTVFSGTQGQFSHQASGTATTLNINNVVSGNYVAPPSLGVNNVNALEKAIGNHGFQGNGTQANMLLSACYRG